MTDTTTLRHDWTHQEIDNLLKLPFHELLYQAHTVHRAHFDPNDIQISMLISIKTGACPEDCKYCPQSGHYTTGVDKERLMKVEKVIEEARKAKAAGATRFCMGAAWKHPTTRDWPYVIEMIKGVRALGMETCMTLGQLDENQAQALAAAGLDYYNHNIDTSPEYYSSIITTRTFEDRLDTLANVRKAGMKVCCGGIVGMGESAFDRAGFLQQLANLDEHPESVPINMLVKVKGTPLEDVEDIDPIEFIRVIATARILMPRSRVRLAAGRAQMTDELQAMAFFAGANSIFYGEKLLTAGNAATEHDMKLLERLGMRGVPHHEAFDDDTLDLAIEQSIAAQRFSDIATDATAS